MLGDCGSSGEGEVGVIGSLLFFGDCKSSSRIQASLAYRLDGEGTLSLILHCVSLPQDKRCLFRSWPTALCSSANGSYGESTSSPLTTRARRWKADDAGVDNPLMRPRYGVESGRLETKGVFGEPDGLRGSEIDWSLTSILLGNDPSRCI